MYPTTPPHSPSNLLLPSSPLTRLTCLPPSPSSPLHPPIPRPPPLVHQFIKEEEDPPLPTPNDDSKGPLFLSVDAAQNKVRACVLDNRLQVVWVEQVEVDTELAEYGTRNGVYTLGSEITCPSELRIKAVDLLLEKLALQGPEGMLARVKALSGAAQSSSPQLLSPSFSPLLQSIYSPTFATHRLSSLLTSSTAFSLPTPPTRSDTSAARQVREIEKAVGKAALSEVESGRQMRAPPSTPVEAEGGISATASASASVAGEDDPLPSSPSASIPITPPPPSPHIHTPSHPHTQPSLNTHSLPSPLTHGRHLLTSLTGVPLTPGSMAAQLLKIRQADDEARSRRAAAAAAAAEEEGEGEEEKEGTSDWSGEESREDSTAGVLERTENVVLESTLLSSLFLGRLAPTDPSDASSTCLYSPHTNAWDPELLGIVMGDEESGNEFFEGEVRGGERLRGMLGEVGGEGGRALGTISPYFVNRFGFSSDCLLLPFTSDSLSSFLSYPLNSTPNQREAVLCLGVGGDDTLLTPCREWKPSAEEGRCVVRHPARRVGSSLTEEDDEGEEEWVAMISNKEAALGRSLARDLYCNGQWNVFSRLTAIVPHGGTIGLDDKYFSFFFPQGDHSNVAAQGFMRFMSGTRVTEFPDRKANPRLLLESQFMSLRYRLSLLYSTLTSSSPPPSPSNLLPFPPLSPSTLPTSLLLSGAPAQNPAIISLLSTIFGAKAYFVDETTEMARSPDSARGALGLGLSGGEGGWKTTSSALGAAYKAAWGFARERGWDWSTSGEGEGVGEEGEGEKEKRSFSKFVRDVKSAARSDGREQEEEQRGRSPRNREREVIDFGAGTSGGEEREGGEDGVRRKLEEVSVGGSVWTEDAVEPEEQQEEGAREGLTLVATPDKEEFKFYASMLREHVRLDTNARRGLI